MNRFPGNRVQKNVQGIRTVPAGRGQAAARVWPHVTVTVSAFISPTGGGWRDPWWWRSCFTSTCVSSCAESPSKAQNGSDKFRSSCSHCPAFTVSPVKSVGCVSPHPARSSALWFLCWDTSKQLAWHRSGWQRSDLQSLTCAGSSSD